MATADDGLIPETPAPAPGDVAKLSRRVAHAVYAMLACTKDRGNMPSTAAEIVVFDEEASSAQETAAALKQAQKLGYAVYTGRYWVPTQAATLRRTEFEERFLQDVDPEVLV